MEGVPRPQLAWKSFWCEMGKSMKKVQEDVIKYKKHSNQTILIEAFDRSWESWCLAFWRGWSQHWLDRDILNLAATSVASVQGFKKDSTSSWGNLSTQVTMEIADWAGKKKN